MGAEYEVINVKNNINNTKLKTTIFFITFLL